MKTTIAALVLAAGMAAPLGAQGRGPAPAPAATTPAISFRPFFVATGERFLATKTFNAVFGQSVEPFLGGGVQVVFRNGLLVELSASRFKKDGERAFVTTGGDVSRLGIPLTATITPFEVSGGYRFKLRRLPRIVPYAAAGAGSYAYKETSRFAEPDENVDTRHAGYLAFGGAEFRMHRWVGVALDAQFTHIAGILGNGGLSKELKENDLGGIAARVKVVVGR